jgi:hypothetical protein
LEQASEFAVDRGRRSRLDDFATPAIRALAKKFFGEGPGRNLPAQLQKEVIEELARHGDKVTAESTEEFFKQLAQRLDDQAAPVTKEIIEEVGEAVFGRSSISGLNNATRLSADELATGQRLESLLGRSLKESPHVGAEFIDDLGRTYDALGVPNALKFWNEKEFVDSIDGHLLKSNDFTVIDLTGFTPEQIAAVQRHLSTLTSEQLSRTIRIGF